MISINKPATKLLVYNTYYYINKPATKLLVYNTYYYRNK